MVQTQAKLLKYLYKHERFKIEQKRQKHQNLLTLALEKLKFVKEKETDEISAIAAIKTLRS